jgi:hypothetical protein
MGLSSLLGKINKLSFFDFSLDKLVGLWYNKNSGKAGRQGAVEFWVEKTRD